LAELFRERWRWRTGETLPEPSPPESYDPWPPEVQPDLTDVKVAISRTLPAYKDRPEVREAERLYRDSIAAARDFIYIENQYLTSLSLAEELAVRLREEQGPEMILVAPQKSSGWLAEKTMDVLRGRFIDLLRRTDRFGRLRVFYPAVRAGEGITTYVHAKVYVSDDRFLRVASSNMANRSLGLDSECDLALESAGGDRIEEAIRRFRCRLLGMHLGVSPETVERVQEENSGSLVAAVERLRGTERTLVPLEPAQPEAPPPLLDNLEVADPEQPIEAERLMDQMVPPSGAEARTRHLAPVLVLMAALVVLAIAWPWSPMAEEQALETAARWGREFRGSPQALFWTLGAYVIGSVMMLPVTFLIGLTAAVFPTSASLFYAFTGSLLGAVVTYFLGSRLGRDTVRRLAGGRLNLISRRLSRQGVLAVLLVRAVPVAPFSVVNMVAGASKVRFREYLAGTVLGMLPGIVAVTLFADSLAEAIRRPGAASYGVLVTVAALISLGVFWTEKRFGAGRESLRRKKTVL
jgi:uncharacterized membrane protein YdjX (TVP38/TMEM64 family)